MTLQSNNNGYRLPKRVKKLLTFGRMSDNIHLAHGGIAQLGARLKR